MRGKCDVCGKETDVTTAFSSCGGISLSYCNSCLDAYLEPYDALVSMGLKYNQISKTYREEILLPSLRFHDKTIEEFDFDVENDC